MATLKMPNYRPWSKLVLKHFALEIVAERPVKLAYANLVDLVTLRFTKPEYFTYIDSFNDKML